MTEDKRPKLDWKFTDKIEEGNVCVPISTAKTQTGGLLYSFCFEHVLKDGKTSKFFSPSDIRALKVVLDNLSRWIDCDREEKRTKLPHA